MKREYVCEKILYGYLINVVKYVLCKKIMYVFINLNMI